MTMVQKVSVIALGLGLAASCLLLAQNTGIQRTVVKKADVSVPGREAVVVRAEFAPGASVGQMYRQAETKEGRIDSLDPDNFQYEITSREIPLTTS